MARKFKVYAGGSADRPPNRMMLRRTLTLLIVCGILAFLVLAAKLFQLQILEHGRYESSAIAQQVRETTVVADRGTIYDRNGKILAMSATAYNIYISPAEIALYDEDIALIASTLNQILAVDYNSVIEKAQDTTSWYKTVTMRVEEEVAEQIQTFKAENNILGVKIENDTKRYYPYGTLAAHVVGFVGTDMIGLGGVEMSYDEHIIGNNGKVVRATTAAGSDMLFTSYEDYYDAEDGANVTLTLDTTMQYYLEKHLQQAIEDYDAQNGACGIIMNVKTGGIYAMASYNAYGTFDLNDYQTLGEKAQAYIAETAQSETQAKEIEDYLQKQMWRNKAISDTYEPGSVFKIITMAMALEEGLVKLDDAFYCGGSVSVLGRETPVKCWKTVGHGDQDLTQALQHSCNVAFVNIGMMIGERRFYKYAEAFGLFDPTGIDLAGESESLWWPEDIFLNPEERTELAAASFGQTFNITPLQLITAVSACVNGGYLMQPHIVSEIVAQDGEVKYKAEAGAVRQVISEETSATIRGMLEQVVGDHKEGTGKNAYVVGYRVGGKTGTSTNTVMEANTGVKQYIVSFCGVAPMDDPEVACLVLIDCPSDASGVYISGGNMGAPTVGKILGDVLPYLGYEAVYTADEMETMDKTVPDLMGLSTQEATAELAGLGLSCRVIGGGETVTAQLPAAHAIIAARSEIIIYADSVPSEELEEVPDLTGLEYDIARQRLGYTALYIACETGIAWEPDSMLVGSQSIEPGTMVEHGTVVTVTLADSIADQGRY